MASPAHLGRKRFRLGLQHYLPLAVQLSRRVAEMLQSPDAAHRYPIVFIGSGGRIRTYDQLINSQLLYH